jgi:inositol oxygenase
VPRSTRLTRTPTRPRSSTSCRPPRRCERTASPSGCRFFGSDGQWDVVGDTFVVGAQIPTDKIVYSDTFTENPDMTHPVYSTKYGIYKPNCGLDNIMISWGHDEYLYLVMKQQSSLPKAALNMIRFHSFYPWHRERAYTYFENEDDKQTLADVLAFNP